MNPIIISLKTPPPKPVLEALQCSGGDANDVLLSLQSDINLMGVYAAQWLIVTRDNILVIEEESPFNIVHKISIARAQEFRSLGVLGSGILQARIDGVWVDVVRYSNRLKYSFTRVVKRLEQLRAGETITLGSEDENDPRRCKSCSLMLEFPGAACPLCAKQSAAFKRILQLLKPYWSAAAVMMSLLLCGLALDMVGPQLTRYLVDYVLKIDGQMIIPSIHLFDRIGDRKLLLLAIVLTLAGVQILRALINLFNGRLSSRVGTSLTFDIRGRLVDHLQKLSLSYYDNQQTGSLVGRVAYDTEAVQGFVAQLTGGFLMQILMVIFSGIAMFSMEPQLAIWTLLPAPFVFLGTWWFYNFILPHYRRFWERSSKQAGTLSGILTGIRVVKAFAQEEGELERYSKSSAQLRDARRLVDVNAATFYPVMGIVFQVGGWLVWYIGGGRVLERDLSLGTLMAFFGYLGMFYTPLSQLTQLTNWITQITTQLHRIFEVLDTPITVPEPVTPTSVPQIKGEIEFQSVTFGYSRQSPVIKGISFKIKAGQAIGVVGRSGSGKTTIINLISRFYDVDDGKVMLDGVDVREIGKTDLRRQVGVVLQEPFLFRGTLWKNLVYGNRQASTEQVIAAAKAGNAHDFIVRQAYAYDTWVGERGAGLSGGERQRLSIARAVLCDPGILILDEATSSVDSESEVAIQQALAELVKGRTTIAIAHRLSTLRNCDTIMVIDDGRIAEQGSHDELMTLNGKYAKLVRLQGASASHETVDVLEAREKATEIELLAASQDENSANLPAIAGHRVRWLTPKNTNIHLGRHHALHVEVENESVYQGVYALRCLPVQNPSEFISLRYLNADNRDQEVGIIRHLEDWPEETVALLHQSLLRRYFVHEVQRIHSIKLSQNFVTFNVDTHLGPMEFIMNYVYASVWDYGLRGKIMIDVEDNRFLIPDVQCLTKSERKVFERYIFW